MSGEIVVVWNDGISVDEINLLHYNSIDLIARSGSFSVFLLVGLTTAAPTTAGPTTKNPTTAASTTAIPTTAETTADGCAD